MIPAPGILHFCPRPANRYARTDTPTHLPPTHTGTAMDEDKHVHGCIIMCKPAEYEYGDTSREEGDKGINREKEKGEGEGEREREKESFNQRGRTNGKT